MTSSSNSVLSMWRAIRPISRKLSVSNLPRCFRSSFVQIAKLLSAVARSFGHCICPLQAEMKTPTHEVLVLRNAPSRVELPEWRDIVSRATCCIHFLVPGRRACIRLRSCARISLSLAAMLLPIVFRWIVNLPASVSLRRAMLPSPSSDEFGLWGEIFRGYSAFTVVTAR